MITAIARAATVAKKYVVVLLFLRLLGHTLVTADCTVEVRHCDDFCAGIAVSCQHYAIVPVTFGDIADANRDSLTRCDICRFLNAISSVISRP